MDIYQINSENLILDRPIADTAITAINNQIENTIQNDLDYSFLYDLNTITIDFSNERKNRIRYIVQNYFRMNGIQCSDLSNSFVLNIKWFNKSKSNFMVKTV